jgi:hypothetical protein
MNNIKRIFSIICSKGNCFPFAVRCAVFGALAAAAPQTLPALQIEKTAETAAAAKSAALDDARRQAFADALGKNGAVDAKKIAAEISSDELAGLIDSIAIENEKSGATEYSADISVEFDRAALEKWLESRGMQSSAATRSAGRALVFLELPDGARGLASIMRVSRSTDADLRITGISGAGISANVRAGASRAFASGAREAGVSVSYLGGES